MESKKNGISVTLRIFVPRKESAEIWTMEINNNSNRGRNLSVFSVCEVILDGANLTYGYQAGVDGFCEKHKQRLFYRNSTVVVQNEKYRAFAYTDIPFDHFDISKDIFLGNSGCYTLPDAIRNGTLNDSNASTEFMVSAFQHNMILNKNEKKRINFVYGIVYDEFDADRMVSLFARGKLIEEEFERIIEQNNSRLGFTTISTPDKDFNNLFNIWLKHQLYLMADWARFYFKGYRDTLQDSAGMSIINSTRALAMLEKALANQRSDGFCPRAFRVPSMDVAAADKHYSDSPSWISHATDALLRETGDLSILDRIVEYSDQGKATIWEHNLKALDFLWNDRGEHGLSLIRHGDWNDLMDRVGAKGRGEGIWMSIAFARALKLIEKIATWKKDDKIEKLCRLRYEEIKENILKYGWDQDHFIYAITDEGNKVGDNASEEGQVFINPQSWAILADIIDKKQYLAIMKKIEPMIDSPVGPMHSWPPFTKYNPEIGTLTSVPQGAFTNGNVYSHAATFKIAADYMAGRNDKAFDSLLKILPSPEKSEPYAQSNGYIGPTSLRKKKFVSDDPWRTGAVAWNVLNVFDYLLGFKRELLGVKIEPQIPSHWDKVSYKRMFRGTIFNVNITTGETGKVSVDGIEQKNAFIEVPVKGLKKKKVTIDIQMTNINLNK